VRSAHKLKAKVLLVGVEDTENIGLRLLSACLKQEGHQVRLVPLIPSADDFSAVCETVAEFAPHIVGFSLIFQNLTPLFQRLMRDLRRSGTRAHFTIGGHYPSFAYEQLLEQTPELDSVALFEGEETIVELAMALASEAEWRKIEGLAWMDGKRVRANRSRSGIQDLDSLPWPDRSGLPAPARPLPTSSLLGSRGCPHQCSFCSIAPFYKENGTPGRRLRSPVDVVDEMEWLYNRGARVLLFQDEDFLGGGRRGVKWAESVATELKGRGLNERLRFRISCRSDEVKEPIFSRLVEAGLTHVYLGVESGDPQHLVDLNKRITASVHFRAGEILRKLGLSFDFGFMLLTPWSTFDSTRNNLSFLRNFARDGATSIGFCRTLPYAGTEVAARLAAEKRLLDGFEADYRFLSPRLDALYDWLYATLNHRNQSPHGTRNLLGLAMFESGVRLPRHPWDPQHRTRLRALTRNANQVLIDVVEAAVDHFERRPDVAAAEDGFLIWLGNHHRAEDDRIRRDLAWLCHLRAKQNAEAPTTEELAVAKLAPIPSAGDSGTSNDSRCRSRRY
jgi:anaerobic magnesium-protoporphyrin IX monomethyl ester cyclase